MTKSKLRGDRKLKRFSCTWCGGVSGYNKGAIRKKDRVCVHCGQLLGSRIVGVRATTHLAIAAVSSLVALLSFAQVWLNNWSISQCCVVAGIAGLLGFLGHLGVSLWDPNASAKCNQSRAEKLVAEGSLEWAGDGIEPDVPLNTWGLQWRRIGVLTAVATSVILMVTPEFLVKFNGWVANPEFGIVGPGDHFDVAFENTKKSINGIYRGGASTKLELEGVKIFLKEFTTTAPSPKLDKSVWNGPESEFDPVATVTLPVHELMAWRKMRLNVHMLASYPVAIGGDEFIPRKAEFDRTFDITLSGPNARRIYTTAWKYAGIGGLVLFLFSSFSLAASPHKPTKS